MPLAACSKELKGRQWAQIDIPREVSVRPFESHVCSRRSANTCQYVIWFPSGSYIRPLLQPSDHLRRLGNGCDHHRLGAAVLRWRGRGPSARTSCQGGNSVSYSVWERRQQSRRTFYPDCAELMFWYGAIGYLGQAVGTIDYVRLKG